jgi:hypothetical protein
MGTIFQNPKIGVLAIPFLVEPADTVFATTAAEHDRARRPVTNAQTGYLRRTINFKRVNSHGTVFPAFLAGQ